MARQEETVVTLEALTCVAGPNRETLGVRTLKDGADGASQLLLVQGPMPSQQTSREESHTGWMEYNGASSKFDGAHHRLLQTTRSHAGRLQPPGLSVSTRSGQYVAQCIGDAVAVSKWEWYWKAEGGEASEAVQRGWKGKDPSPPIPKFGDRPPIVAQLWLSEDAKAVAVLAIDPDDFSNREVYLLARASATGSWPPYWKAKPEIESPNRAKGLNLSAQELFLGRVLAQFFDTPQTGWCCHVAHVWRRVEEGDQYRGFPPQLIVQVRALCIKMDTSVFKSEKAQLQLQTRESWMALEQALNVGLEDVLSSPVVARMDPTGSVLAIVVNHAAGTPLLFVGMPGFELGRNVGTNSKAVEQRVTTLHLDDYATSGMPSSISGLKTPARCEPAQDVAWTADGSLLGIISSAGSLLVLPKLGMPLPLKPVAASEEAMAAASTIPRESRASAASTASMPTLQKRLSMPICPINLLFPKFALNETGSAPGEFASSVPETAPGSALAASQAGGSQAGESASAASKASRRTSSRSRDSSEPAAVKKRIFTLCGHANSSSQFAICDGSVTVVVQLQQFETHSLAKLTQSRTTFSTTELVEHLISPQKSLTAAMIYWPTGYLESYAAGATISLGLGLPMDVSAFAGWLTSKRGTLRVRTDTGDWAQRDIILRGSHLFTRAAALPNTKPDAWRAEVRIAQRMANTVQHGRVLVVSDGARELELQGGSTTEIKKWKEAIENSGSGANSSKQRAAALLRCIRKVLQAVPWASDRTTTNGVLKAVRQAFEELLGTKQLYLAMHLLATAEYYISHTAERGLVLSKQWEQLRKEAAKRRAGGGLAEDMFFGNPQGADRAVWSDLETVSALRACGGAATHIEMHSVRLQRLNSVAAKPITSCLDKTNTKADSNGNDGHKNDLELLAVGHRLYFDRRWPEALEYYKASGKAGRCALFAMYVIMAADGAHQHLEAALQLAMADIQDDAATTVNWEKGDPAVKDNYVIVYTMARLMHAIFLKQDFAMWAPVIDVVRGAAPKEYKGGDNSWSGKWYDSLRKRTFKKGGKLHAAGAEIFVQHREKAKTDPKADLLYQTIRLCYCARLPNAPLPGSSFVRDLLCCDALNFDIGVSPGPYISFKQAVSVVLRAHPAEPKTAKASVDKELQDIMRVQFTCALRRGEIQRADKLIAASEQLFNKFDLVKSQRLQATMFYIRIVKQSLVKLVFPVPKAFELPAKLRRYEAKIVDPGSPSTAHKFEENLRQNTILLIRQCWFLIAPAVPYLKVEMGKLGWAGYGSARGIDEGDVTAIAQAQKWGDFALPYRLLLRYMWFQELRDTFSLSNRTVNRLHAKYGSPAQLSRGESLSYRFEDPIDEQELLAERISLACTAVRLLAFDDIVHISRLHELVLTCIEDIERELSLYRPAEKLQLLPLKEALALYLPELIAPVGGNPRHQTLRKKIRLRCPLIDEMLETVDNLAAGAVVDYEQWNRKSQQQTDVEKSYGMWNYEFDREFQLFIVQNPVVRRLQDAPSSPFQSTGSPVPGSDELSKKKLVDERKDLREKHAKAFNREDLATSAGTGVAQIKFPDHVGIDDSDGHDVSREKQATFDKMYAEKSQSEERQKKLCFPIVTIVDGVAFDDGGAPLSVADIQTTSGSPPEPQAEKSSGPSDNASSFKILSLTRQGGRSVNLTTKASYDTVSSTVNVLRHEGAHARARRRAGTPLTLLHIERPAAPPTTVGDPLPDQEYDIDPYTGAVIPVTRGGSNWQ